MARIPDEVVEQVRDAADLLEIVQEQVQLKRTGSVLRGPCPFHQGTGKNFAVFPKTNSYYCFVCHVAGDIFTRVMTIVCRPGSGFPIDWNVLRPMIIGLPQVRSLKRRRSVLSRQSNWLSRPITPFSATATTIIRG